MYDFTKSKSNGYGYNDQFVRTEAYYGLTAYVKGQTVYAKFYNNNNSSVKIKSACVESLDKNNNYKSDIALSSSKYTTIDTSRLSNGLYGITEKLSNGKNNGICFYVNGKETWLCSAASLSSKTASDYRARKSDLAKLIKNAGTKPSNTISNDKITYPSYEVPGKYRCDTQLWIDLSNTIVKDSWSDEYKVYVISEWLIENIAYDQYKCDNLTYSRAVSYKDNTGTWSVYNTRTGVCGDFANIFAIMCRAHGVSATTVGAKSMEHVWNAVYLNGRWVELDLSVNARYQTKTKDVTKRTAFQKNYVTLYGIIPNYTIKIVSDAAIGKYLQGNSKTVI